jgi:hypothetical protein
MGMMGYKTPNIDRIAKEGANFSPTGMASKAAPPAARASSPDSLRYRTGLTKVGLPGAPKDEERGSDDRRTAQGARAT